MPYVYVLRSTKNNKRYIGFTSKDVQQRLTEHNQGSSVWTKNNGPFTLVYAQVCDNNTEAREWENFLKSGQGRQCLDELGL
jgi:putative endonuclease